MQSEVPYSCEVTIDAFTEKSPTLSVIEAGIVVARRSQKAILIGKDGAKVKELGILARGKLEQVRHGLVFQFVATQFVQLSFCCFNTRRPGCFMLRVYVFANIFTPD
jgi:GTPase Era involved in 16S rRNA processing